MWILQTEKENELIFDYGTGTAVIYYRQPGTSDKLEFQRRQVCLTEEGLRRDVAGANLWGGKAICTGMRDGDFGIPNQDNPKKPTPISSNKESEYYREDWLDLLEQHSPEFLAQLGAHAFKSVGIRIKQEEADVPGKKKARKSGGE